MYQLQLNKANSSVTEAPFDYFRWFCFFQIYDKCDDFDFDIVNVSFLDGDIPRASSYWVYIFQPIRFARVSYNVAELNSETSQTRLSV